MCATEDNVISTSPSVVGSTTINKGRFLGSHHLPAPHCCTRQADLWLSAPDQPELGSPKARPELSYSSFRQSDQFQLSYTFLTHPPLRTLHQHRRPRWHWSDSRWGSARISCQRSLDGTTCYTQTQVGRVCIRSADGKFGLSVIGLDSIGSLHFHWRS
jgi:hypothetical protein